MHALDVAHAVNAATGLAFVALGVWVLLQRSGGAGVAFAGYALSWAGGVFLANLFMEVGHATGPVLLANATVGFAVLASLVALVAVYPTRASRADLPAAALAAATVALATMFWGDHVPPSLVGRLTLFGKLGVGSYATAHWVALFYLAFRWRAHTVHDRRSIALVSAALVLWPAVANGDVALHGRGTEPLAMLGVPLLLALTWLAHSVATGSRSAGHVAWVTLGATVAGMSERVFVAHAEGDLWAYGISRLVGVSILAYAIVRHHLLGIDVKLRFAISKSTIAAVFIAVFFITSEAAQQFFGETLGSAYVGIAAAGALVFAIAPLQRAAERLAERAVPISSAAEPAPVASEKEEMYREAVRLALRDRTLSRADERHLFRLARGLGLTPDRAHEILVEVEAETGAP